MSRKPGRGGHQRGGHQRGQPPPPAGGGLGNIQQGMAGLTLGTGQTGAGGAQPPLGQVGPGMPGQHPPHLPGQHFVPGIPGQHPPHLPGQHFVPGIPGQHPPHLPGQFIPGMHQHLPHRGQRMMLIPRPQMYHQPPQYFQQYGQTHQHQCFGQHPFLIPGPQVNPLLPPHVQAQAGQFGQFQPQAQIQPGYFTQTMAATGGQFPKDFDAVDDNNLKHHTSEEWEVKDYLAKGGFGTVYEVSAGKDQLGLKKGDVMAVKIMKVFYSKPDAAQRIQGMAHEISINTRLIQSPSHANVLTCVQVFQTLDVINSMERAYMIMEICQNGSADQVMEDTLQPWQGFSEYETRWLVMNLARGIEFLKNTVGMAHLDIKPGNILMFDNPDPNAQLYQKYLPKLCDFSLAAIRDKDVDPPGYCTVILQRTTIGWGSPEAFPLGSQQPYNGFPVDVYTLGTVAYFLRRNNEILNTTHNLGPVYEAPHVNSVKQQQNDTVVRARLTSAFKDLNQGFGNLLMHMLREQPQDRPTIETVLQHPWLQPPNP